MEIQKIQIDPSVEVTRQEWPNNPNKWFYSVTKGAQKYEVVVDKELLKTQVGEDGVHANIIWNAMAAFRAE